MSQDLSPASQLLTASSIMDSIKQSCLHATDLAFALDSSLKRQALINIDILALPSQLYKISHAIHNPPVQVTTKVANVFRPMTILINKITTDFELYEEMCSDIQRMNTSSPHLIDQRSEDITMTDTSNLPAHDSFQAEAGAECDKTEPFLHTEQAVSSTMNDIQDIPSSSHDPPTPEQKAQLTLLNESYVFLAGTLLAKLKALDKLVQESLTKPPPSVRSELLRTRWDDVVREWRAEWLRVWVGCGGHADEVFHGIY